MHSKQPPPQKIHPKVERVDYHSLIYMRKIWGNFSGSYEKDGKTLREIQVRNWHLCDTRQLKVHLK